MTEQEVARAASTVLRFFERECPGDSRVRLAIEARRKWAAGALSRTALAVALRGAKAAALDLAPPAPRSKQSASRNAARYAAKAAGYPAEFCEQMVWLAKWYGKEVDRES